MFKKFSTSGAYMSKKRWWWWSILGLIGLYLLMLVTRCAPIEKDIQARAEAAEIEPLVTRSHPRLAAPQDPSPSIHEFACGVGGV